VEKGNGNSATSRSNSTYNFPYVQIVEFELSADEYDHLLSLNFNNTLPYYKGLLPVFQGALAGF
jgi:hypothetical protein